MKAVIHIVKVIDKVNNTGGRLLAWLVIPLTLIILIEIFMRYVVNNPTIWAYDTSWMLFSVFFLLGGGFTMVNKRHVRVDLLYSKISEKAKIYYELAFFLLFFLPLTLLLAIRAVEYAADAFKTGQSISSAVWEFPIAPVRTVIPVAFFLLFMQGISEVLRNILLLTGIDLKAEDRYE